MEYQQPFWFWAFSSSHPHQIHPEEVAEREGQEVPYQEEEYLVHPSFGVLVDHVDPIVLALEGVQGAFPAFAVVNAEV